nr:hypothetical protein B0A51_12537 [Rachicladosporium sp. CCFEE 5018]
MSWIPTVAIAVLSFTTACFVSLYQNTPRTPNVRCIGCGGDDHTLCVKWTITNFNLRTVKQEALDAVIAECHVNCGRLEHQKCWPIDTTSIAMNYTCVDEDWFPRDTLPLAEFEALRLQTREGRTDNEGLVCDVVSHAHHGHVVG